MRRIGFSFILLAAVCMLSGCGSSKVELTDEQNGMVAEYIAGALLRYDMRYEEELIYTSDSDMEAVLTEETVAPLPKETEQAPAVTPSPEQTDAVQKPEVVYSSLTEMIGLDGIELTYKGSSFYKSYPKKGNDVFVIEPSGTNQLLVAEFKLSNASSKQKKIDLSEAGIKYTLHLGGKEYKSLLTALPDDLRYLNTKLEAGKKKTVVVVFEVEKDASLTDAEITITRDSLAAYIKPL